MIAYFSRKMILDKNRYKTYNVEYLGIVKIFKTKQNYLQDCKYNVIIFINYYNFC